MRVICNPNHAAHVPPHEVDNGAVVPPWEVPGRYEAIRAALAAHGGFTVEDAPDLPAEALTGLHDAGYVAHLRDTSAALAGSGGWVMPSVFPFAPGQPRGETARRGAYCFDTFTAITAGTWAAALGGAAATCRAARLVAGGERAVYALTRPPGHHAERGRCGGYSFLNNAALAANLLLDLGPVAVLDIDVHHGNGTQHLFYADPAVLTVSVHGDPAGLFPYFSGFADETGSGRGLGFNLNVPLPPGTGVNGYRPAIAAALERAGRHRPAALVVAFGADAHAADPIGGMRLPTAYFAELGAAVRALGVPAVVTQEGGYDLATVGDCAVAFLAALGGLTVRQQERFELWP